jgi:hypothetical protein
MRPLLLVLVFAGLCSAQDLDWSFTNQRLGAIENRLVSVEQKLNEVITRLDRPKRIQVNGLFYDVSADGKIRECEECNAPIKAAMAAKARAAQPVIAPPPVQVIRYSQPIYQMPAQGVPAGNYFPGRVSNGSYDPDHTCNRCGAQRWEVDGFNGDGTHTHVCQRCGNSWRH